MADNKRIRDYRDRTRINTKQKYEMKYWTTKFGISTQQLVGAIKATGSSSVARIQRYLKEKGRS